MKKISKSHLFRTENRDHYIESKETYIVEETTIFWFIYSCQCYCVSHLCSLLSILNRYNKPLLLMISFLYCYLPSMGQTATEKLNQALSNTFQQSNIPGIAMAIVSKDKILYQNEFGYADLATYTPYTQHTIHNIASTSKTFIGVALMQLVEKEKVDLDTDINEYLPFTVKNPKYPSIAITLRQLATHTSSIRDRNFNYGLRAYVSDDDTKGNRKGLPLLYKIQFKRMLKNEEITLGDFLENTLSPKGKWYKKKNFYKVAPATTENYSNIGSALAAYIIEVITGEKYADYVQNNILTPLKMKTSGWEYESVNQQAFAKRYIRTTPVPKYKLITYPDGGLISSTADLSTYLMAMMRGYHGEKNILTAASFQTMMRNQFQKNPLNSSMGNTKSRRGIFWDIFGEEGNGDIGHSGSDPGVLTFMYFDAISGIGCLLMTNTDEYKNQEDVIKMWELLIEYRANFAAL